MYYNINDDYVRGFADADGGFNSHFVALHNTDIELLKAIGKYLKACGIKFKITYQQPKGRKKIGRIQISGLKNLLLYAKHIGFCMKRKQEALENRIRYMCRPGKPYNPKEYELYKHMKYTGVSYRKMAKAIGLSPAAIHRREGLGIYPLDEELFRIAKGIVYKT